MQRLSFILAFVIVPLSLLSQVLPREGSRLNYRIVGFSFPAVGGINTYRVEIAKGNYSSAEAFEKNVIFSPVAWENRLVAEVPVFGADYTWRVVCNGRVNGVKKSPLYHFSTIMNPRVDTTKTRLTILQGSDINKDDYVAIEGGGVIYDMKGNPVWCIADSGGLGNNVSDIKFTPQGTITFMIDQAGYDIDYNGKLLWHTPSSDSVNGSAGPDYYHHEFTRLANGHYMILGMEYLFFKKIVTKDSTYFTTTIDKITHTKFNGGARVKNRARFGILIELDEAGNVVWSWKSSQYLLSSDYMNYWPADTNLRYDPHDNAFYFDEKNHAIYLSYRELSRIVKIDYPSGKVLNAYGEIFRAGIPSTGNGLFCNQHNIMLAREGDLYLFNNNICEGANALPSVLIMKPMGSTDGLEKVWEYKYPSDERKSGGFPSGGTAIELPDHSMFICLASDYPKLLIVGKDKKVSWSAIPELYDPVTKKWDVPKRTYRANIIDRKGLERMIWAAGKN